MDCKIIHGDALEVLRGMADNSVDAIVTDPPYGLSFMGKRWDYDVPSVDVWAECLRVLKPGGHLLAFAGTRTQHRMAVRIEDAGFEIRDMIAWVYGSGFPKSLDVSKAIDKAAGAEREVTREGQTKAPEDAGKFDSATSTARERRDAPATESARKWQGWGTALKPSYEPLTLARKPLDIRTHCVYLAQYLTSQICQYSASVRDAAPSSSSSQNVSSAEPSDFVLWTAVGGCNTPGDLFALMDTLAYGSELPLTLSTVCSWLRTLDGLLQHESTFTTETVSSLTTDLKTLNSLLSTTTPAFTIEELTEPSGRGSSAELVACIFNAFDASLKSILARFVHGNAIAKAQENYRDAGVSPSLEPITVARKPLVGTVAANVLEYGTGAINVDGCRVATPDTVGASGRWGLTGAKGWNGSTTESRTQDTYEHTNGRWPANLIHDGSDEVMGLFPLTGASKAAPRGGTNPNPMDWGNSRQDGNIVKGHDDNGGSAARFFYCAKASKSDRGEINGHPTVKPTDLMRYLVRLVTPPGGTVLDPFTGSGSTGKASVLEGFEFIGIEREAEYVAIAEARIEEAQRSLGLFA